jgi:transglutaminase-like putative cysteine protease
VVSTWAEPIGSRAGATAAGSGALLLSTAALGPLFTDASWAPSVLAVVVLVALTGVGLRSVRCPLPVVVVAQLVVVAVLVTVLFTSTGLAGVLPGPAAVGQVRDLLSGAGTQIRDESVPVPVTPELQLLLVLLLGAAAVAVDVLVADLQAPAGAGLVLLTMVAVPASLLDQLLPWWSFVLGALALVLLLVADGAQRVPRAGPAAGAAGLRAPGVLVVVALAVVAGLLGGSSALGVGTSGRLAAGGGGGGVGLNPFTQLRGQLDQPKDVPLFTVQGLNDPTYLRAVALDTYVADQGWVVDRTADDQQARGPLDPGAVRGPAVSVTITPQQYTDRWLPSPGTPTAVQGTGGSLQGYTYDQTLDTLHTRRSQPLPSYRVQAVVPGGTADELRAAGSPRSGASDSPGPRFYATTGIDPQVRRIAETVTGGATDALDAAVRLTDYFRNPANGFTYSVQTADPGAGKDALVSFLTDGKTGFCEQFASSMAAMMRSLGFPSRVSVGFTAGTGDGVSREVTTSDAHAWVEVYFAGTGWVQFDPTPLTDGRGVVPGYVTQAQQDPAAGTAATTAPGAAPTTAPRAAPTAAAPTAGAQDPLAGAADGGSGTTAAPSPWPHRAAVTAAVVAVVVAVLGAPAAARALRRRRRWADGGPDAAWDEVLDAAADRGVALRPSETPRQTALRLDDELALDAGAVTALHALVDAVERSWYGSGGVLVAQQSAAELGHLVHAALRTASPVGLRGRLLPPSLRRARGASSL